MKGSLCRLHDGPKATRTEHLDAGGKSFHEPAITYYAKDLGKREPEKAIAWCERILDSQRRLRCL